MEKKTSPHHGFMKPTTILILAILLASCRSNKVITDTIPVDNDGVLSENTMDSATINEVPVLQGTTVLIGSAKNRTAQWVHGLYLQDLRSSPCRSSGEKVPPTEITSVSNPDDSTLVITANVFANCASYFLGEIEVVNDSTINLIAQEYGGFAACGCCFGLTYRIELFRADDESDFSKYSFVTINGVDKTRLPPLK